MSIFCELLITLGVSGVLGCPSVPKNIEEAYDEKKLYAFEPAPEPEPEPKALPNFPAIIIREEKIIKMEAPPPPAPEPLPEPEKPDELALHVEEFYKARQANQAIYNITYKGSSSLPKITAPMPDISDAIPHIETYSAPYVESTKPVDNSLILTTDRYITGILETGINSQLAGDGSPVVIQVSRDVFGYHDRNVLIPKGSRLVCSYSGPDKQGVSRSDISCNRIFLGSSRAEIWQIKSRGADSHGHLGVSGNLDNRFFERYGKAILLAGISSAVRASAQTSGDNPANTKTGAIFQTGAEELSQRFGEITSQVLEQTVNLKPILKIPQGTRLQIRPQNDWYIAKN